jgi:hypothetical protein
MNENTKEALKDVINGIELIVQSILPQIGMEYAMKIIDRCERAKKALDADETIF